MYGSANFFFIEFNFPGLNKTKCCHLKYNKYSRSDFIALIDCQISYILWCLSLFISGFKTKIKKKKCSVAVWLEYRSNIKFLPNKITFEQPEMWSQSIWHQDICQFEPKCLILPDNQINHVKLASKIVFQASCLKTTETFLSINRRYEGKASMSYVDDNNFMIGRLF